MNKKINYLLFIFAAFLAGYYAYSAKFSNSKMKTEHVNHEMQHQIVLGVDKSDQTDA
ncbi:hypothetical protein [Acinetobacter sp. MD2(2019)]|uniref:hypothetical protein n=1 Tax=Acinetobacter sp. MD2(2019) TaxID=2605273 RepID=UPI002D1F2CBC|nr:hypothetical protein [Acinetobacter sp. MD2(2019)]MEB3753995.1 hypothetical protein [Acinetobacter sp. MD2(2019)]